MTGVDDLLARWHAGDRDAELEQFLYRTFVDDPDGLRQVVDQHRLEQLLHALPHVSGSAMAADRQRQRIDRVLTELRQTAGPRRERRPAQRRVALAGVLVAVALLVAAWLIGRSGPAARSDWGRLQTPEAALVWRDGEQLTDEAASLLVGDLVEATGPVRLRGAHGATLDLSAGSSLLLSMGSQAGLLLAGDLTAEVPPLPDGGSWSIRTPQAEVLVVGTRFSIQISNGQTRLSVSDGQVQITSARSAASQTITAGQAVSVDQRGTVALSPQLIAHWAFEDGEGRIATDSSGNGHFGQLEPRTTWTTGVAGGGLYLGGYESVDVDHHPAFDLQAGTFSLWLKPDLSLPDQIARVDREQWPLIFLSKNDWRNGSRFDLIHPVAEDNLSWGMYLGHGPAGTSHTSAPVPSGLRWYHLASTWESGGEVRLYVDGELVAAAPMLSEAILPNDQPLRIARHFIGVIDDVRVYAGALEASAIEQLFLQRGR